MKKLALWAGRGQLPYKVAMNAKKEREVIILAFKPFADVKLLKSTGCPVFVLSIGEMKKNFDLLKKENVKELVMLGKFDKKITFTNIKFDALGLKLFLSLRNNQDMTIFSLLLKELEKRKIAVVSQLKYLKEWLSDSPVLTKKKPTKNMKEDGKYGFKIAKNLAELDIGQTIVVHNQNVVAIEASEGTDSTIKRAGGLLKKGGVVIKVSRKNQDERFDVPTVGLDTLHSMLDAHIKCLVIEKNKVLLTDKNNLIRFANQKGMVISSL